MASYFNLLINFLVGTSIAASGVSLNAPIDTRYNSQNEMVINVQTKIPDVLFYSQFSDIDDVEWQKLGCGIASLAMLIEFYKPGTVAVNTLLKEGIDAGAYLNDAGWKHRELALLASKYGLKGENYDLSSLSVDAAFAQFKKSLKEGPVIASVHYKFDLKSSIPHLAVISGIDGDTIYYNDPAGTSAGEKISIQDFIKVWKKRFITVRL
ncbi:MAG: papain-like cysteine protease family protein [bacterium]|nr:papain-like cysteine protease family protein [bacterium]